MGYIKHDAVIALFGEEPLVLQSLESFLGAMPEPFRRYFVGPVEGMNGTLTFVVTPDGSKEGWEHSDQMDRLRSEFIAILKHAKYHELVHLRFGGDDRGTTISFASENRDWESEAADC